MSDSMSKKFREGKKRVTIWVSGTNWSVTITSGDNYAA